MTDQIRERLLSHFSLMFSDGIWSKGYWRDDGFKGRYFDIFHEAHSEGDEVSNEDVRRFLRDEWPRYVEAVDSVDTEDDRERAADFDDMIAAWREWSYAMELFRVKGLPPAGDDS